ncbi:sec1 family domain-containing protein 2-like isoform X2 [Oratosquilla oratoria]
MQAASPYHVSEAWWTEALKKVKNAVVFLDEGIAECLHWHGGLVRLVNAKASDVKEFSSFECGGQDDTKGVFLISSAIHNTKKDILRDIIQSSCFQYCVVISAAHPNVHSYARFGGRETDETMIMNQLEQDILTWMGNLNYTVEIFYLPLVFVPATDNLLLLPAFSSIYPLLDSDIPTIARLQQMFSKGERLKPVESLGDVEFNHLPHEFRTSIRQLVVCLHSLLVGMNAREEIFTIGHTARIVGTELENFSMAKQSRKNATNKVSIVFVDRTLDLVSATTQSEETMMDRILTLLPRLYGHRIDSAVNMAPLSNVHMSSEWTLIPGNLVHAEEDNESTRSILESMLVAPKKETLSLINKKIIQAANKKSLESKGDTGASKLTVENLKSIIQLFSSDMEAFKENAAILQQGLGVVEMLTDNKHGHLDQLVSVEKLLLQSIGEPDETPPFTQILQLLRTRESRKVSLDEILCLMLYVVSLGGPQVFSSTDEYALTNFLSQAIVQDKEKLSDTMMGIVGVDVDEVSALKASQRIAGQLHAIASARVHLKKYRSLYASGDSLQPSTYHGFLNQLVYDCFTAPQPELLDLEYKSGGFRDLIKTGFSLFVNVSKPVPRDAPVMMVFVVGGITPKELQAVRETVKAVNPACQVVVASTHLTYPKDTLSHILQPHPYLVVD